MNTIQQIILGLGIIVVVLMSIVPPVQYSAASYDSSGIQVFPENVYYKFVTKAPLKNIMLTRLIVQYLIVIVITGLLVYFFKTTKKTGTDSQADISKENPINYPIDKIVQKHKNNSEQS